MTSTTFTPLNGALAAHVLGRQPDLGDAHEPDAGNRITVTAGGVVGVYDKGPASRVVTVTYSGLTTAEVEALQAYIDGTLDGSVEPFTFSYLPRTNLLTHTRDMANAAWLRQAAYTPTYPGTVLAPDGSNTATEVAVLGGAGGDLNWYRQAAHDARGISAGETYGASVWHRADVAPGAAHILQVRGAGGAVGSLQVSPTTSWQRAVLEVVAGGNDTALEWRLLKAAGTFADHTLHVWHPTLQEGAAVGARYQPIGAALDLVGVRMLTTALPRVEREPDVWDTEFSLLKVGT